MRKLNVMILMAVGACQSAPKQQAADLAIYCPILQANAEFSCWWSDNDAPLSHCVLIKDNNPGCGMPQKAISYFNRGAVFDRGKDHDRPNGTWMSVKIYEDSSGRVGLLRLANDVSQLGHHSESDLSKMVPAKPPIWPRWPNGVEGGPEQRR